MNMKTNTKCKLYSRPLYRENIHLNGLVPIQCLIVTASAEISQEEHGTSTAITFFISAFVWTIYLQLFRFKQVSVIRVDDWPPP